MSVFEVRSSDEESTPVNVGLDEYAIRKKIIESKTTELNVGLVNKTSETVGQYIDLYLQDHAVSGGYFKLLDENQVVLRTPRQNGVYSLDLKNIVPSTGLENQLNHKVKIIRCDHGIEFKNHFKNHAMNEFCAKKGIKREFSVARTPQQNGVAERKNRTLIEAARTMLADSLLPIPFWAEAVNTACYMIDKMNKKAAGMDEEEVPESTKVEVKKEGHE
ncbi:ribonuclease H-like domain-containing protein [Tanacetum coccineum]